MLLTQGRWKEKVKQSENSTFFMATRYSRLVSSQRCLEGGRDRNGAPDDFVFTSCQMLFAKGRWKEKVKLTERSTMFYGY